MKVTAVKGKSAVIVHSWGRAPFGLEKTKRGVAYIPDGFTVEAKSDSQIWMAETRVNDRGNPEYRFALKTDVNIKSDWRSNPTAAYKEVNTRSGNAKFLSGSNGRIIIGVTYENLQAEIMKRFGDQIKEMGHSQVEQSSPEKQQLQPISIDQIAFSPLSSNSPPVTPPNQQYAPNPAVHSIHPQQNARCQQQPKRQRFVSIDEVEASNDFPVEQFLLNLRQGLVSTVWTTTPSSSSSKKSSPSKVRIRQADVQVESQVV